MFLKHEIFGCTAATTPIISTPQANIVLIEAFKEIWLLSD
jgi:hypothetical protein